MAAPVNTLSSYDVAGIREDLADWISNVDPHEAPFTSACKKVSAKNTFHEWQTDALRASAENAHIEGDDTTMDTRTATTRLGNYTQIFKNSVSIPGTDSGLDKAGRTKEMAYQVGKIAKEQRLDIEKAIFSNTARSAGSSTTARFLAGAPAWMTSNITNNADGSDPTGDGTDARTDGTQTAFTQADFDSCMQSIWENGGRPEAVYLSAFQMDVALGFTGNNNQRSTVSGAGGKVINHLAVYMTPWGEVTFTPTRENRGRDVFIMQKDMWQIANLRSMKNEPLAKTGDSDKRQIVCELTLVCKNEKASGMVVDCSTS